MRKTLLLFSWSKEASVAGPTTIVVPLPGMLPSVPKATFPPLLQVSAQMPPSP